MIKYKDKDIAEIKIGTAVPILESKTIDITENGTLEITADPEFDGLSKVTVNTNVESSGGDPDAQWKEIGFDKQPDAVTNDIAYSKKIMSEWDPNNPKKFPNDLQLTYFPLVDTSNVTTMNRMFWSCTNLKTVPLFDTSSVTNMGYMFSSCANLKTVPLFDTRNVTTMSNMLVSCSKLTTVSLFDTRNVTDMSSMFDGCANLTTVPLFDTRNVTDMSSMFNNCFKLTTIPQLDTSSVTDMSHMFEYCSALTTVPQLDTTNVTNMRWMFSDCTNLKEITLIGDPSKVTDMAHMFNGVGNSGTLIYDSRYDYTKIIDELKQNNPTWTVKSTYEPTECTSLSITADDVANGNLTTTTIYYTAVTNGDDILTGEHLTGVTVTGNVQSEPFEKNPSFTDSRQLTITYTYLGQTATTTITQSPLISYTFVPDEYFEEIPTRLLPAGYKGYRMKKPNLYDQLPDGSYGPLNGFIRYNGTGQKDVYCTLYGPSLQPWQGGATVSLNAYSNNQKYLQATSILTVPTEPTQTLSDGDTLICDASTVNFDTTSGDDTSLYIFYKP